ncbi:uncharacterized protein [Nicotiana sylvestris]|uniref:uncharacterized protein n=1 Tax=Nicotiana sylvestris TaxID=4096 RepID=UPI00388C839F
MKSLSINVPLVEDFEQIPGYAKFMKDHVTKKWSMNFNTIKVTHQVSAIVQLMAPKLEDPGTFTIPCTIRSVEFAKALCDHEASINLMPYSVFKTLGIGKPRPISMGLQMADHTMKRHLGVIEDVLVDSTLSVQQKRKKVIGWTLTDIREISAAFCMHKINLEDGAKPSIEHQMRLNEAMQKIVKEEIIKWCMMAIFTDMMEDYLEVFMDDFSVVGDTFDDCFANLDKLLAICEETNLLNWEKFHFMVEEDIVLGHKISKNGIEIDKAKIELLEKDAKFNFNDDCMRAFELLKFKFTTTHLITAPNWSVPFELMYGASDIAVEAVLGQCINKIFHPVQKSLSTQIMRCFVMSKKDSKARLMRLVLLLQEFDIDIQDRKEVPWFVDLANFLARGIILDEFSSNQRKNIKRDCQDYYWDGPYLFRICMDGVIRRCVPEEEQGEILGACHSSPYGGHHGGARKVTKLLSCGFYWPTLYKDANELVKRCDECQQAGRI